MSSKTKEYYNRNAVRWAAMKTDSFWHEKPFRFFEGLLRKNDHVLDIGCAYGIHIPLFLGIGRKLQYYGIDISKSMLKVARARYPQFSFKLADALSFKARKKFNAFWSAATLMHVPINNWPSLLDNIERNMKKSAVGYITLPSIRPNPASSDDQRHFELFNKNTFRRIAKDRNWKIVRSGTLAAAPGRTWFWYIVKLP